MATWDQLVSYITSNYKISNVNMGSDGQPLVLKLEFETTPDRSQLVFVSRADLMNGNEEWALIESPIGRVGEVPLEVLFSVQPVCGGFAGSRDGGTYVMFRHSVPLANLDANEFDRPLLLVTSTADDLESRLAGSDRY